MPSTIWMEADGEFKWQAGYGVLSISEGNLEKVMPYAAKQKEHHKDRSVVAVYERMEEQRD